MLGFVCISLLISPPFLFLVLFTHITDQEDGRTKAQAQRECLKRLIVHPVFWLWIVYAILAIGYTLQQINLGG